MPTTDIQLSALEFHTLQALSTNLSSMFALDDITDIVDVTAPGMGSDVQVYDALLRLEVLDLACQADGRFCITGEGFRFLKSREQQHADIEAMRETLAVDVARASASQRERRPEVTTLQVAVHPPGTAWLGTDATVLVKIEDEGAGPYLNISSWDGPANIESLAMLEAVTDAARRLLAEAEGQEGRA